MNYQMPKDMKKELLKLASNIQKGLDKVTATNLIPPPNGVVPMVEILRPGESGNAKMDFYTVTPNGAAVHNLRHAISNSPEMAIVPGNYARLQVDGELMMTDTPFEARSNRDLLAEARGDVLIAGLGIGMILVPVLLKRKVKSVLVVEKSKGVISLTAPCIEKWRELQAIIGSRPAPLEVAHGDIFEWLPPAGRKFDVIYFDIWPSIAESNLSEGTTLKKRFKKYLKPEGWMGVWVEAEMRKRKRETDRFFEAIKKRKAARKAARKA